VRLAADGGPAFVYVFVGTFGLLSGIAATTFIWAGIDSIRCRRWVRPVIIALAWPALLTLMLMIAGLVLCAMTYVPPGPTAGSSDRQSILFVAVLYTMVAAVPGAFLIFYTRSAVRETLAAYDPSPSWTEASALPVFVGCVSLALFGLLTMALSMVGAVPVFGVYVTGERAAVLCLAAGAMMLASGVLMHVGQRWAWWMALSVVAGGFTSAIVTFCRLGMMEFYRRGGFGLLDLEQIERTRAMTGATPIVIVGIVALISVGYLGWMRRFLGIGECVGAAMSSSGRQSRCGGD
jgi:hypothetical protein